MNIFPNGCCNDNKCKNVIIYCNEVHEEGYICCREKDHKGNHVACLETAHNVKIWRQK